MRVLGVRAANPTSSPAVIAPVVMVRVVGAMTAAVSVPRGTAVRAPVARAANPVRNPVVMVRVVGAMTAAASVPRGTAVRAPVVRAANPARNRVVMVRVVGAMTAAASVPRGTAVRAPAVRAANPTSSPAVIAPVAMAPVVGAMTAVESVRRAIAVAVAKAGRDPGILMRPETSARTGILAGARNLRARAPGAMNHGATGAPVRVPDLRLAADTPVRQEAAREAADVAVPVIRVPVHAVDLQRGVRGGQVPGRTRALTARNVRAAKEGEARGTGVSAMRHVRGRVAVQPTPTDPPKVVRRGTPLAPVVVATGSAQVGLITVTRVGGTAVIRDASRAVRAWIFRRILISSSFRAAFALSSAA